MSNQEWQDQAPTKTPIWLDPADKPNECFYAITQTPARPTNLSVSMSWSQDIWPKDLPDEPSPALYLGSLEWAWSPMHSRLDSYYLSYTDTKWLVFLHNLEDSGFSQDWAWDWYLYAIAERMPGDERAIAFWLIHDLLMHERTDQDVDRFHFISDTGLLSVGDFKKIGELVWET